jgi:hypothetical protein
MVGRKTSRLFRGVLVTLLFVVLTREGTPVQPAQAAGSSSELVTLLQDVTRADGSRYHSLDDQQVGMDTLKIIPNPQGGYLGIYHHLIGTSFQVRLATSSDLLTWHYRTTLVTAASQPTIASLPEGGFVVGYEKKGQGTACGGSGSCLAFHHYANMDALLAGMYDQAIVLHRTLSRCNEGTPTIYAATLNPDITHSIITIGFHYYRQCKVDREALGTLTNFATWNVRVDATVNALFTQLGTIQGNVGDRDAFFYQGKPYSLIEAQSTKKDFGSWRPYLFDRTLHSLTLLTLHTQGGSTAFGNPTSTDLILPNGQQGFVSTEYLFSEGAARGEGGELIYYKAYPRQSPPDTIPPRGSITHPANGSKVREGSTVTIKATASDDVGIAKVAFFINGMLTCVSPFAPSSCNWTVPSTEDVTYTITATAFDIASNTTSSSVQVRSR